jgi:hypothetical protein
VITASANKEQWTEEQVRNAYDGKLKLRTVLVEQTEGQIPRAEFHDRFLQKTENQMKQQWSIVIFSGGRAPLIKADDRAVYDYVKQNADSIGYVSSEFYNKEIKGKEGLVEIVKIK